MKERALVAGGTFNRESQIGKGTVVTAEFPRVWIEEQMEPGTRAPALWTRPASPSRLPRYAGSGGWRGG